MRRSPAAIGTRCSRPRPCGTDLLIGIDAAYRPFRQHPGSTDDQNLGRPPQTPRVEAHVHSCPAFIACYHEKFGTLCYTNAGHTPGLLRDGSGVSELGSTGLPLGLFSHATADAQIVGLEKGSVLLLVSRGVVACEKSRGDTEEFGLDRVKQLLQSAPATDANGLCTSILNSASEFSCAGPPSDDRTALALIRLA